MEGYVLAAHAAYWTLPFHQALEIVADVGGPISVTVKRQHAVPLCATPQPPHLPSHLFFLLFPRATLREAATARLRRVRLRSGRHDESTCELAHESDADAGRVASIASGACLSGHHPPRPVRKDDRPRVSLFFAQPQAVCTASPPSPTVSDVGVKGEASVHRLVARATVRRRKWPGRVSVSCSRK